MLWFYLSIGSAFALALAELSQQNLLNTKNPFTARSSTVLTFLTEAIITIPLLLALGLTKDFFIVFSPQILPRIIFVNLIASIGMVLYLKSFKVKNISLSVILNTVSVVVTTILGILLFSESINTAKILGITFVLASIILLNYKNAQLEKNHLYALIAGIMFGMAYTTDKSIVVNIHPVNYMFWVFFLTALISFFINPKLVVADIKTKEIKAYYAVVVSSLGYFLYNLFTFSSYKVGGEVGKIDAINTTYVFIIILFEYFILKHTKGTKRKLLSALIAFVGVVLLGLN